MDSPARREAILEARRWLELRPVYLDTETTGIGPSAEIVEVGIVDHDGAVLVNTLVRPKGIIEPDAMRIHGITPEMVSSAPTWEETWPQVDAALKGRRVGVYNSEFDLRIMAQSHQRSWLRWDLPEDNFFCIMKLYARFHGEWDRRRGSYRWQSLDAAGRQCRIPLPNAHRAVEDAHLARAVLHHIAGQGETSL